MAVTAQNIKKGAKSRLLQRALGLRPQGGDESELYPFDHRKAPLYPCDDSILVALTVASTPIYQEEDEVRWPIAIGMVVLDTRDLCSLSPGKNGSQWIEEVREAVLWRLAGRQDHPRAAVIAAASPNVVTKTVDVHELEASLNALQVQGSGGPRQIIFIGDHIKHHLAFLAGQMNCKQIRRETTRTVDTLELYGSASLDSEVRPPQTLSELCTLLGIPVTEDHNIGCRARYNLQAILAIAVRAATKYALPKNGAGEQEHETGDSDPEVVQDKKIARALGSLSPAFGWAIKYASPPDAPPGAGTGNQGSAVEINTSSAVTAKSSAPPPTESKASTTSSGSTKEGNVTPKAAFVGAVPSRLGRAARYRTEKAVDTLSAKSGAEPRHLSTSTTPSSGVTSTEKSPAASSATNSSSTSSTSKASTATPDAKSNVGIKSLAAKAKPSSAAPPTGGVEDEPLSQGSSIPLWDCVDFLEDHDRFFVSWTDSDVFNLPHRISDRVEEYTVATIMLQTSLIGAAQQIENVSHLTAKGLIAPPIKNFEHVARVVRRKYLVGEGLQFQLRRIIELRTFVSDWHDNIPGISPHSEIVEKTARHRAFTNTLRKVLAILER